MPFQIVGDDGRVLGGDDAQAAVIVGAYDDGSMAPDVFVGAAQPLMFRGNLRPQAQSALSQRLNIARNLLRGQNVTGNAQIATASPGPIREVVQGLDSINNIAAGASLVLTINASMIFRPTRLMVGPALASLFTIDDIRVAADSLFLSAGAVPAEAFLPNAVTASALKRRTAQPGTPISLTITNIDGAPHRFRAAFFGEATDVSSC